MGLLRRILGLDRQPNLCPRCHSEVTRDDPPCGCYYIAIRQAADERRAAAKRKDMIARLSEWKAGA